MGRLVRTPTAPKTVLDAVRSALSLLTPQDRRRYWLVALAQMLTAFLDLGGVLLIGLVGVLATASIQDQLPPEAVTRVATSLGLGDLSTVALAGGVAAVAAFF